MLFVLRDIRDTLRPRPTRLDISLIGGTMPLEVGATSVAAVTVLDQNGTPITDFDFSANPPQWSLSDPSLAAIADNAATPELNDENVTGVAAGTGEVLTVTCAGLSTSVTFDVVAAPAVPTSLLITLTPPV